MIPALEAIPGWSWEPLVDLYAERLEQIRRHVARHGWQDFTINTRDDDGVNIGKWANHIRDLYRKDRLPDWLCVELESIPGWMWEPRQERQQGKVDALRRFVERYGLDVLRHNTVFEGVAIGEWFCGIRDRRRNGLLPAWLRRELEAIPGWSWGPRTYLKSARPREGARSRSLSSK
jgi:hypothetical protein